MKANVINLVYRQDRLLEVAAECKREGLQLVRHEAVNGQDVFFKTISTKRMRGHAGCQSSHMKVLQSIKGTSDWHLIIEDDAVLLDGFLSEVKEVISSLPIDATMCYLGGNTYLYEDSTKEYNDSFVRAYKVMATHCYLVKDESIDNILHVLNKRWHKVDVMLMEYQMNNVVYMTKKCLSWQRESFSNIGFKTIISSPKY